MDTSDASIVFDKDGICDHCRNFDKNIRPYWKANENQFEKLEKLAEEIRKSGKDKDYDCVLGLSGGADSSYMAYIAKEVMHLRPLAIVVDTGWNLNVAVENIERIVKGLNLDLYTEVVNWKEMSDLQRSFFQAGVSSCDQPQDHAIFAGLYNYAAKHGIQYVLTGSNNSTEFIRPPVNILYMNDLTMLKDIHRRFGKVPLKTYPMCSMFKYKIVYPLFFKMKRVYPLDYVAYEKEQAEILLHNRFGWERYENKHYENVFTRFFEGYYLPRKFGYDTRRNVLSNEILVGTITRDEALEILSKSPYDQNQMEQDKAYIAKKIGITLEEFEEILNSPPKKPDDYKNEKVFIRLGVFFSKLIGKENRNLKL